MEITRPKTARGWAKSIAHPATEFSLTPLPVISGIIPTGLRGSLYRNGAARLERGEQRVGHWFDGDGAVLAVHFTDVGASAVYRYVQTAGYQAEEQAQKFLFGGYGMIPAGPIWKRLGLSNKNCANTSVMALPDKLLTLWEGGQPHALDLQTLDTFGLDHLGGLGEGGTYSAHPKRDPLTGDIYNFGVAYGRKGLLYVYRSDRTGQIQKQNKIVLDSLPLIHDFVLAGRYLVFFIPPVQMNPLPYLAGMKSFSDSLSWQPEKGTQVLVIDRETLTVVSRGETEPWFQWHFGNGCVDTSGSVVLDVVRYEDFHNNQRLKEVATGQLHTPAEGTLWQIRLDPRSGKVTAMHQVVARDCESPTVAPNQVGQPWRFTYLLVDARGNYVKEEWFRAIARFDYQTEILTIADLGDNRYPISPIYAPDAQNPDQGWILSVVFDGDRCCSEVWIFDAAHLDAEPVCRLELPSVIPLGFDGIWKSA